MADPEPGEIPRLEVTARVRRALPQRRRRMVGAWSFVDHLAPMEVGPVAGLEVGPHRHTGLATLTWLLAGEALHRDSLGSEQLLRLER